ncbi:S-adenosylmethionine decarboxylase proenzyme [Burkholderiales bacterium JOSHI_001]|nr:S-adenosylmethionine decarboxylase proenzyme [Burkholderiales bacterium JOSHI_001]
MQGLHLTADLFDCQAPPALMTNPAALRQACEQATRSAGLTAVGAQFHRFAQPGGGVTGVLLLAESHLAVHTWPEHRAVTLDAYVCNFSRDNSAAAEQLVAALVGAFAAGRVNLQRLQRGVPASVTAHN